MKRRNYFDVHPGDWDGIYNAPRDSLRATANRFLRRAVWGRMAIALSEAVPIKGRTALDVGCGPGELSIRLAERGAAAVVGIDSAAEMIRVATSRAEQRGVASRCRFLHGTFPSDALGEQRFDFTAALGVFDYVSDAPAFLAQMWRRTGAKMLVTFPRDTPPRSWLRRLWHGAHGSRLHYYGEERVRTLAGELDAPAARIHWISGSDSTDVLVCERAPDPRTSASSLPLRRWSRRDLEQVLRELWATPR